MAFKIHAQTKQDTTYYNEVWQKTTRDSASYYKLITKDSSLYKIECHYIAGGLWMTGTYTSINPEIKEGYFKYYSENGNISEEGAFIKNKHTGIWKGYFTTGQLRYTENYKNGRLDGEFISYYRDGIIKRKELYNDSVMVKGSCFKESGEDTVYYPYQVMPVFKGDMNKYISKNMNYPQDERESQIEGTVYVRFYIETDGSVGEVKLIKGVPKGPGLDKEALRVIAAMPKWKPGMQDGEPKRVYYIMPLRFSLN